MNTCWKCGQPTGTSDSECARCDTAAKREMIEGQIAAALEDMDRRGVRLLTLDWDQVQTLEDYRIVCQALLSPYVAVSSDHPHFEELKRFLKSPP